MLGNVRAELVCRHPGHLFPSVIDIAVIGGGPAGLRAAEVASAKGASVTLFDAKASVGRKFLVAGRGGLNLTHSEPMGRFATRYSGPGMPGLFWPSTLAGFDPAALRHWASGLGVETFIGTSGRVFPLGLKAAPLLRRWIGRLRGQGVHFAMGHRWTGLKAGPRWSIDFESRGECCAFDADAVVLALGGGSWPTTGSDGTWVSVLGSLGVEIAPLTPANCGWDVAWPSAVLAHAEGMPLKNIVASVGAASVVGELLITKNGLEGGVIYQLGPTLRETGSRRLLLDLKPTFSVGQLVAKLGTAQRGFLSEARARWRLSDASFAVLAHLAPPEAFRSASGTAQAAKGIHVVLSGPRPMPEAISSAGGIAWSEVHDNLMLKKHPGIFVAGEMIDWEAPTGGYLMQGCFATGTKAGDGAAAWAKERSRGEQ